MCRAGAPRVAMAATAAALYLEANPHENTLLRYRYNREFRADRGRHGEGSNCTGHSGEDMILKVPVGTVVFDEDYGRALADLDRAGPALSAWRKEGAVAAATNICEAVAPGAARIRRREAGRRAPPPARTEIAGRRGPGGFSERGQIHADLAHFRGAIRRSRIIPSRRSSRTWAWFPPMGRRRPRAQGAHVCGGRSARA